MLSLPHLRASVQLAQFLMNEFEVTTLQEDGGKDAEVGGGGENRPFRYAQLCHPYCETNWPLELFVVCMYIIYKL
jgi:hypothetical protein